jgi:eukaryotic translation initiation factor 2-alpha kinase 4
VIEPDIDTLLSRLDRVSPALAKAIATPVEEIRTVMQYIAIAGVRSIVHFRPLMFGHHHGATFRNGVCFEAVKRNKRTDVLAIGGRLVPRSTSPVLRH